VLKEAHAVDQLLNGERQLKDNVDFGVLSEISMIRDDQYDWAFWQAITKALDNAGAICAQRGSVYDNDRWGEI
jgi:hypothetical protein